MRRISSFLITLSLACSLRAEVILPLNSDQESWAKVVTQLSDPELRPQVEKALAKRAEFPRKELVSLLDHPQLAVRIGALELLEDASGETFDFSPWLEPDKSEENKTAIELWKRWAKEDSEISKKSSKLSPEQLDAYIRNLLSDDRSRGARAVRMMEGDNFTAVAAIQAFIASHPELPTAKQAQLKQAQYELVLIKSNRATAPIIARDLVFGNRDQQLAALGKLKQLGLVTIPIIRDFIDSPDALVRETSIDTLITVGGRQVLGYIADQLKKEKDVNVIHIAIRKVKDIPSEESVSIIDSFLEHADEDIVVSAVTAITKLSGGADDDTFSRAKASTSVPKEIETKILAKLDDPRWRVRVAVLEYIESRRIKEAKDKVIEILKTGEDEFVRAKAISAAVSLNASEALPILEKLFLNHDELIGSLTDAYMSLTGKLPDKLYAHLLTRDSDTIISAMKAFSGTKTDRLKILANLATNKDLDVACVALRSLASDDEKLKHDFVSNTLTDALNSGSEEKIQAVLSTLDLPRSKYIDPRLTQVINDAGLNRESSNLDPLYDAFIKPNGKRLKPITTVNTDAQGGVETLKNSLVELAKTPGQEERTFQICLILTKAGDKRGLDFLQGNVAKMPVSKRSSLAESLYKANHASVIPIFTALLQDESSDIRQEAAENALSDESNSALIKLVLDNLILQDTKLKPQEIYKYRLDNIASSSNSRSLAATWCRSRLAAENTSDEIKILCCLLLRHSMRSTDEQYLTPLTESENQWIRRAAWHCLGTNNSRWFEANLSKLINDTSTNVRVVLPEVTSKADSAWMHHFNDIEARGDNSYSSSKSRRRLSKAAEEQLYTMARGDAAETNRFEAYFSLMSHSRDIDLTAFIALINKQPESSDAIARLSEYVEDNYRHMGKGMRPLLAYIDFKRISQSKHQPIMNHFQGDEKEDSSSGFTTFEELATNADTTSAQPQHLSTPEERESKTVQREKLVLVFFEKDGCAQCAKAIEVAQDLQKDFPMMEIKRFSISSNEGILLNAHLSRVFNLPATADGKVPSFFTSSGYIVPPITAKRLGELLEETMETPEKKGWYDLKAPEQIAAAKMHVEEKYDSLTLPIVIAGGLLDGINPCAFATIIFFLSYLTVAKRSPKEIFMVGSAFILAVFLSYLSVGLLFSSFVKTLTENSGYMWLRNALNYIFAAFALLVAVLSFRDYLRARKGKLDEMTLQLPSFLKNRIRGVIRKGAKSSRFVIAAFFSGIAISFLELACTGQVYAPIIYKINQGSADAVSMLVIYNLAFVLPLIVIFALAMGGMKSNALIQFQQKHTAMIKLLTAGLFFLLFAVLLFSEQISGLIKNLQPAVSSLM